MNKKLVLTGKAVLSTVMASTMACSMLSTNILAQEPEVVPEEETTVEKTPVEEETTATEEPTETPEEATGENSETEDLDQNGLETPETNVVDSGDTEEVMTKSSQDITFNFSQGEHRRGKSGNDYSLLAFGADWVEFNGKRYTTKTDKYNNTMCVPIESIGQLINVPKGECRLITIRAGVDGDSEGITFSWYEDYKDPILTYVETGDNYVLYESDEPLSNERTNYETYEENGRYFAKVWTDSLKTGYNSNTVADSVYPKNNCNSTWYIIYKDENGNITTADQVTEIPKMEVKTEAGLFEFNSGDVITKNTSDTIVFTGNGMKSVQLVKDLYYGDTITNPDYSNTSLEYKIDGGLEDNAKYSVKYSYAGGNTTLLFYTDFSQGTYAATLSSTIEEYESKDLQAEDYSNASWQAYQTALTAAQQAYNDPTANNDEMKQAEADLDEAFNNLKEAIDTTKLEEAIKNFGNLEGSGSVYDNYVKVLNNGKALLEDPEATQVKVDNAARNIETCYYKVKVAALNTIYNPDTFDYSKYTTDSIIPVQNMYGITHNRTNNNYQENEAQGNIGQMALWLEKYEEAVAGLTLADQDEKYIGLNKDALSSSSKKQGNFNVIKQEIVNVDGTYKIQLTMEFINDGLHPIYGSELPNANSSTKFSKFSIGESDAKKARVHTYDSKMGASRYVTWQNVSKLDGQAGWSKGFKGTIILESDEEYVTFEFKKKSTEVAYSPWYYHVQPMDTTAPEVVKIVPNQDGTILVKFSEPVTINDPEWKESENPYEQGGQYWIGTLTEDKIYTVVATDTAGNGVEFTVDHKDPVGNVTYQENEDGTVTVTIAFDERITVNSSTQNPGWTYNEDFTAISKTFDKNAQEQVTVHDNMDNETVVEVNVDSFDETAPEYTVTYSNDGNPTNQDVTVIITANEPLQEVEGWTLSDDGLSLTKTYSENKEETVVIADASGNTSEVPVNVTGIDKLGPTVTVKNETTEDGVLVTIETSEPIQTPDGWTKVSDTKYTKLYTENTSEDIIVYDLAGNATKAHVTVSSISKPGTGGSDQDKNQGTDTKKEDSKKTDGTNTGVFVGTGLFAGSATAAAAGASLLAFLKKRKK